MGVAVADLKDRVGPLDPLPPPAPKEKKIAAVPKPKKNDLEKMCEDKEDNDMSEYARIRQKNIRERLALFNKVTTLKLSNGSK